MIIMIINIINWYLVIHFIYSLFSGLFPLFGYYKWCCYVQVCLCTYFFSLGYISGNRIARPSGKCTLNILKTLRLFSRGWKISTSNIWVFKFFHTVVNIAICLSDHSHSSGYEGVFHCASDSHFPEGILGGVF